MSGDTLRVVRHADGHVEHEGDVYPTLGHFMAATFGGTPADYGYEGES